MCGSSIDLWIFSAKNHFLAQQVFINIYELSENNERFKIPTGPKTLHDLHPGDGNAFQLFAVNSERVFSFPITDDANDLWHFVRLKK
jgi:hypothetical protein